MPTLKDAKNFIQGYGNYLTKDSLPPYVTQQIQLRAFLCQPCLINGRCLGPKCNCKTPAMFYAPNKEDSKGKWAEFFSELQWAALVNNIDQYKLFIDELKAGTVRGLPESPQDGANRSDPFSSRAHGTESIPGSSLDESGRDQTDHSYPATD